MNLSEKDQEIQHLRSMLQKEKARMQRLRLKTKEKLLCMRLETNEERHRIRSETPDERLEERERKISMMASRIDEYRSINSSLVRQLNDAIESRDAILRWKANQEVI